MILNHLTETFPRKIIFRVIEIFRLFSINFTGFFDKSSAVKDTKLSGCLNQIMMSGTHNYEVYPFFTLRLAYLSGGHRSPSLNEKKAIDCKYMGTLCENASGTL